MENNLISVIVPVYNVEKYIEQTLNSILQQSYKNFEVIIVDDGSTDSTDIIVEKFVAKQENFRMYRIDNSGVTKARLFGVSMAKGEWISFVDGDDLLFSNMYELLMKNALDHSVDISHCGYQMLFEDGRINYFYNTGKLNVFERNEGIVSLLEGTVIEPSLCNKLFRKELIEEMIENKELDYSIKENEDLLINYYLFSAAKKSVFLDECLYVYKIRSNSSSRTNIDKSKIFDPIKVRKIILDDIDISMISCAKRAYIDACINTYNSLLINNNTLNKEYLKEVREEIIENKEWCNFLNGKRRILANLLMLNEKVYKTIYQIYAQYFQVKKYE